MPYSINLRSDNDSAEAIKSLLRECEVLESSPSMRSLNYPPHITLAVYDDISEDELIGAFDIATPKVTQVIARIEHLGYFETPNAIILWAAPALPSTFQALHEHIHALIDTDRCRPYYRPGVWLPHCSLAIAIPPARKAEAEAFARRTIQPLELVFDTVDCASFLPVKVIHEKRLLACTSTDHNHSLT